MNNSVNVGAVHGWAIGTNFPNLPTCLALVSGNVAAPVGV